MNIHEAFAKKIQILRNLAALNYLNSHKIVGTIENPITGMCKCGHRWSWHYLARDIPTCYAHEIIYTTEECKCEGYKEQ